MSNHLLTSNNINQNKVLASSTNYPKTIVSSNKNNDIQSNTYYSSTSYSTDSHHTASTNLLVDVKQYPAETTKSSSVVINNSTSSSNNTSGNNSSNPLMYSFVTFEGKTCSTLYRVSGAEFYL